MNSKGAARPFESGNDKHRTTKELIIHTLKERGTGTHFVEKI